MKVWEQLFSRATADEASRNQIQLLVSEILHIKKKYEDTLDTLANEKGKQFREKRILRPYFKKWRQLAEKTLKLKQRQESEQVVGEVIELLLDNVEEHDQSTYTLNPIHGEILAHENDYNVLAMSSDEEDDLDQGNDFVNNKDFGDKYDKRLFSSRRKPSNGYSSASTTTTAFSSSSSSSYTSATYLSHFFNPNPNSGLVGYTEEDVTPSSGEYYDVGKDRQSISKFTFKKPMETVDGAPLWVAQHARNQCANCQLAFPTTYLINPKRNCNYCGEVFCHSCTSYTMKIPNRGPQAVNVCNKCKIGSYPSSYENFNK